MQLWKKNFLVVYFLFLTVIYGSLLFLDYYMTKNELAQWISRARVEAASVWYLMEGLKNEDPEQMSVNMEYAVRRYRNAGIRLRVTVDGERMADSLPKGTAEKAGAKLQLLDGDLVIRETGNSEKNILELIYLENLDPLYENQRGRTWLLLGAGTGLAALLGILLYLTMERINRPVSQIAHELRTPLTRIRGYAQYIMMSNITEEDRFYAAAQIAESSCHLEDIVEKLLIMGNVREGALRMEPVEVQALLEKILEQYPQAAFTGRTGIQKGDRTLIRCLFENLLSNAAKAGEHVTVTLEKRQITVWNDGEYLEGEQLKLIRKGQRMPREKDSHGYGLLLCQEIVGIHGWKLEIASSREEGTTVVVRF